MKTLTRLNEHPSHFMDEGMCPHCQQKISGLDVSKVVAFRRLLLNQIGGSVADNGEESLDLNQLGLKLRQEQDSVDLEDAEFRLLKKYCERNQIRWVSHFQSQVLSLLKESESSKKE